MSTLIANAYWIVPGKLIGGAYPASSSCDQTLERLQALVDLGVTSFVDLTEKGESIPYAPLLSAVHASVDCQIKYVRKPLLDHKVPRDHQTMHEILVYLQEELAEGHCVYLHCRAGIGRTGMVAGCFLVHTGMAPSRALKHLQHLWEEGGRSVVWPHTPETDEQADYVRRWSRQDAPWWRPWRRRSAG